MRELIDDIDGSRDEETVVVGLDGRYVQVDLSTKHADEPRAFLAPYMAACRIDSVGKHVKRSSAPTRTDDEAIRSWAKANGVRVERARPDRRQRDRAVRRPRRRATAVS